MSYSSFASVYDDLTLNVDYKRRADYIADILKDNAIESGLLLDLACGTGSLSVELAKKGFDVIATDSSADMLTQAQNKVFSEDMNIMFLCQKMQETDLYGTVRAIVCSLDSVNHLENIGEFRKTLNILNNFIDDDGVMIFDVNTLYKHREVLANNTFVYDEKNVYCVWQNRLLPDGVTVNINLDFFVRKGEIYERYNENFKETAFSDSDITNAVYDAGFKVMNRYADLSRNEPEKNTERVYYVIGRNIDG